MKQELKTAIGIGSYVLLGISVVVAVVTVRLLLDGHFHFNEARHFLDSGDRDRAAVSLEDAAKAYVPGSPYTMRALRDLAIMARAAEMRGEEDRAVALWEVLRRSVLATRHMIQPNEDVLITAEKALKRILTEKHPERPVEAAVVRPEDPSPFFSIVLFLGLLSWIVGSAIVVYKPKNQQGKHLISPIISWSVSLGGLGIWLIMASVI